jgi:uncharacterized glyoxalase superfamily protein PhnB
MMNQQPVLKSITPLIPAGGDIEKSIAFYEQQLGFTTIYTEGNPIEIAIIRRDAAEIILQRNDDRNLAEWTTFRIQVENIEQLYQELLARGGEMIHPNGKLESKPWGMKEFTVLDVAGVGITFYEVDI